VSVTDAPWQKVVEPLTETDAVGTEITLIICEAPALPPQEFETEREYVVVADGETTIEDADEPVLQE
jgi:hypothetical protein